MIVSGVRIGDRIVPLDSQDAYATHDQEYGKGGYKQVADITDRDRITPQRRTEGMEVWVVSESKKYRLEQGVTNSNWVEIPGALEWETIV